MSTESWLNLMRVEAGRGGWHRKPSRVGLVDSYDPKTHSVKIRFQPQDPQNPDSDLSGWIPLTGLGVGDGFGILSAPNIGDQVEVIFQEGDHLSARVMTRHWSEKHPPPEIQAGEHYVVHETGAAMKFLKDGTVTIAGAGTQKTNRTQSRQAEGQGQPTPQPSGQPQALSVITLDPQGNITIESGAKGGNVTINSPKGTINLTAAGGKIVMQAGEIELN